MTVLDYLNIIQDLLHHYPDTATEAIDITTTGLSDTVMIITPGNLFNVLDDLFQRSGNIT